jgi:putative PIN family toxin of toxin-antitoxin system
MTATRRAAPRWVLDTNVVLSALVHPGGITGRLRLAWQKGLYMPLASRATATELIRVLAYPKFKLTPDQQHDLLADYLPWTETVRMPARLPETPACRDPDDLPFLQLAVASGADALVTGDADLLVLAAKSRIPTLTPAQAIGLLSDVSP